MSAPKNKTELPIDKKYLLSIYETSAYFGLGINRVRELVKDPSCSFAVKNGSKTMIIREKMQEYILNHRVI